MSGGASDLLAQADRAVAARDLARAQSLLRQAADAQPGDLAILLKLAGISRAAGQPRVALQAVHEALAVAPRDFTALLMRASLLERVGDSMAGEAWGHALAQKPDGDIPPQLESVLADAQTKHARWVAEREAELVAGLGDIEEKAGEEERKRIRRFRTNALRQTRIYHSEPTDYHFPGLVEREFHPRTNFPWLDAIEAETDVIADEFATVMATERHELVPYVEYPDHLPLDQWKELNRNPDWSAIHLLKNGVPVDANARHAPRTLALLQNVPQPIVTGASPNAMFSLLAPHTSIPPHVGINNARLVCHLPLIVPEGCWFRVGAETRHWRRGEAFVFDDTIEHEAKNPSDKLRVVLIFDVWHPDLSAVERDAVTAMIGGVPPGSAAPR